MGSTEHYVKPSELRASYAIAMISGMPFSRDCGWSNEITGIQVSGKLCSLHIDLTVVSIPLMRLKEANGRSDSC